MSSAGRSKTSLPLPIKYDISEFPLRRSVRTRSWQELGYNPPKVPNSKHRSLLRSKTSLPLPKRDEISVFSLGAPKSLRTRTWQEMMPPKVPTIKRELTQAQQQKAKRFEDIRKHSQKLRQTINRTFGTMFRPPKGKNERRQVVHVGGTRKRRKDKKI